MRPLAPLVEAPGVLWAKVAVHGTLGRLGSFAGAIQLVPEMLRVLPRLNAKGYYTTTDTLPVLT